MIGLLIVLVLALLARYVVFRTQFEEWGAGLQRIEQWQQEYKAQNPDTTDEQMETDFRTGIEALEAWKVQYKKENPNATDAEVDAAFDAAWGNR